MLLIIKFLTTPFVFIFWICLFLFMDAGDLRASSKNFCIDCHQKTNFQVQNKKLYNYFQEWKESIHRDEGVSCNDCHGGDSTQQNKVKAHGNNIGGSVESNLLNFKSIPKICGQCHGEIYKKYRQSNHFKYLNSKTMKLQGPNCVTCHGSINSKALDVNSVETVCLRCHNIETGNSPENPKKAQLLLNKFLSINRFYRYVSLKDDPIKGQEFLQKINHNINKLSADWHSFDLEKIEAKTQSILRQLKEKRVEIKNRNPLKR